jgi:2-(1,2-epoxy-1,2-dihydrophenyl)acetyl-CoA isomerase
MNDAAATTGEAGVKQAREGSILILTIDNVARRNALSPPVRTGLIAAIDAAEADTDIRAIVLTGAGGTFCAGGDVSGMHINDLATGRERFRTSHALVKQMIHCAKPIVAAVEGYAVGAGFSLALCCDTIVAAETARFGAPFGRIGLIADLGLNHTLPARIGAGRARQLLLYGEQIDAATAERFGAVDHVTPKGQALNIALTRARLLADAAPLPIALTKALLAEGLDTALEREKDLQSMLFLTADHAEGRDAFLQKRPARFRGT